MVVGVKILIIIALMGGLIAYMGDKLGTKVGKRRTVPSFGLRPKHTSIIVTMRNGIVSCSCYSRCINYYISKRTNSALWDGSVASRYEAT